MYSASMITTTRRCELAACLALDASAPGRKKQLAYMACAPVPPCPWGISSARSGTTSSSCSAWNTKRSATSSTFTWTWTRMGPPPWTATNSWTISRCGLNTPGQVWPPTENRTAAFLAWRIRWKGVVHSRRDFSEWWTWMVRAKSTSSRYACVLRVSGGLHTNMI